MTNYLTRTGDGERKRGMKRANANTDTAHTGQTLKHQGKRKSGRTTDQTQTRGGGGGRKPDTTYNARAKPPSACERPKPDLTHGSTHEIRESIIDAPSFQRTVRDKAQRHGWSMHPDELIKRAAQHIDQKKVTTPGQHVLKPETLSYCKCKRLSSPSSKAEKGGFPSSTVRYIGNLASERSWSQVLWHTVVSCSTNQSTKVWDTKKILPHIAIGPAPVAAEQHGKRPTASLYLDLDELPY